MAEEIKIIENPTQKYLEKLKSLYGRAPVHLCVPNYYFLIFNGQEVVASALLVNTQNRWIMDGEGRGSPG